MVGPEKAPFFPAVTKNGIEGGSWGESMGFKVSPVPGAAPAVAAAPPPAKPAVDASGQPVQAPIAETLPKATGRVQLYINFATDQDGAAADEQVGPRGTPRHAPGRAGAPGRGSSVIPTAREARPITSTCRNAGLLRSICG